MQNDLEQNCMHLLTTEPILHINNKYMSNRIFDTQIQKKKNTLKCGRYDKII